MIKLNNIAKIVLLALFICAYSFEAGAQVNVNKETCEKINTSKNGVYDALMVEMRDNVQPADRVKFMGDVYKNCPEILPKLTTQEINALGSASMVGASIMMYTSKAEQREMRKTEESAKTLEKLGIVTSTQQNKTTAGTSTQKNKTTAGTNTPQNSTFCGTLGENNVFSTLISTGQKIFNRLRDLIYVVAGFGIIAIAVGGFFGNLNWKWLGAIVISLLVIASAGELLYLITGCKDYNGTLITNTLTTPSTSSSSSSAKK